MIEQKAVLEHVKNADTAGGDFFTGLVFGFDVGTGSIGWAVRRGQEFLDVGVLICPEEIGDLKSRRDSRRQRRTLRSRKYRRQWFAAELEKIGLPKPPAGQIHDPVSLRLRALNGESLKPEELHAALAHLFKRRGYTEVPWAGSTDAEDLEEKKERGIIKDNISKLREEMNSAGCKHPCQLLARRQAQGRQQRQEVWPRELLQEEFAAIVAAQSKSYPLLAGKADWLLHGDLETIAGHPVYFKTSDGRNPGVLGLRWPRFQNRSPGLDALSPVDEQGRPRHVVRKNKPAFIASQWELAVMNFRVLDRHTGALVAPNPAAMARLRELWESSRRKKKPGPAKPTNAAAEPPPVIVTQKLLNKWVAEHSTLYKLVEGQPPLTPQTGAGRARYSTPTLAIIRATLAAGGRFDPPQPVLQRTGESASRALDRNLAEIKHPLVRHRLVLFNGKLKHLVSQFGRPDIIILEAVRSLALGEAKKKELIKRNLDNCKERASIRDELGGLQASTSRHAILRYRLWKEAKTQCPFCLQAISREQLLSGEADLEHLVPRAIVDCNEFFNLTIGHTRCNREVKGDRTPFAAFHASAQWEDIKRNAEKCFHAIPRKLEIFLSPNAETLIERSADLQHTAYIARLIRHVALLQLGWLGADGRDPTIEQGNLPSSCFQVTNGQLTSRLRQAWGLNHLLHPLLAGQRWDDLTLEEKARLQTKNRGDLRHHALDALVISCTLPWLAHRTHGATDVFGRHGWWSQDEKRRSIAANPIGLTHKKAQLLLDQISVEHHISRSPHQAGYKTTLLGKLAADTYAARELLTSLKPKDFADIHPRELGDYLAMAWEAYYSETSDIAAILQKTKGRLPVAFIQKLCFAQFQHWRQNQPAPFAWAAPVRIPIRSVKLVSVKDDSAVYLRCQATQSFVKRDGFKEVQIFLSRDGAQFVPVFIPYWKGDVPPGLANCVPGSKPILVLRKNQVLKTLKPFANGQPAGQYRLLRLGQIQAQLIPAHVAHTDEALTSFGLSKSGLQPRWKELLQCLGYELPHPPSTEPPPPGSPAP